MSLHKITKQTLLKEPFSLNALKLARAIYYTYLDNHDDDLYLQIKLKSVFRLLKFPFTDRSTKQVVDILEELNEPLEVRNFKFFANEHPVRFVTFCKYEMNDDMLDIELSEEFLLVESEYMIDKFLTN